MNIQRSKKNNIPLYFQLEQIIKSKILMGEFLPGEQIPQGELEGPRDRRTGTPVALDQPESSARVRFPEHKGSDG